jgi:amidase
MIFVQTMTVGTSGLAVGIKDSIDIAGYPTRAGSRALAATPPAVRHADVVESLLRAGCRVVGKTNMHELAFGVTGINDWTGTPVNPRFPQTVPGGSSSGSAAAVAAEVVDIGIGTDTGGSIRVPAACCGVYGLKPTYGRISRRGVLPAQSSLDCVGPMARSMAVLEAAMCYLDPTFKIASTPTDARVGVLELHAERTVDATVHGALEASGLSLRLAVLPGLRPAFDAALAIIGAETWAAFGALTRGEGLGADVRTRLLAASQITQAQLAVAESVRASFRAEVDAALQELDALALPTMTHAPPALSAAVDSSVITNMTALVRPFNLSGHPAITIPLVAPDGLPVGLQLIGRMGGDASLCALARRISAQSGGERRAHS